MILSEKTFIYTFLSFFRGGWNLFLSQISSNMNMLDLMMHRMRVGVSHLKCAASGIDVLLFYFDSRTIFPRNVHTAKTQQTLDLCICCTYQCGWACVSATIQHIQSHLMFTVWCSVLTFSSYQFRVSSHKILHFFVRFPSRSPSLTLFLNVYAPHVTVLIFAFLLLLLFSHR